MVKAVRGATSVENNTEDEILNETKKLLQEIINQNDIEICDLISVYFTVTNDLTKSYPAKAARGLGWTSIPLLDAVSPDVEGKLGKCIRVMIHFNTDKLHKDIKHIYLNKAVNLRPDLVSN